MPDRSVQEYLLMMSSQCVATSEIPLYLKRCFVQYVMGLCLK